jgi:phosphopantetheinyl transferase
MAEALYALPKEVAQNLQRSEKVPGLMKLRVAAQLLERHIGAEYTGAAFKDIRPFRTARGKPYLPGSNVEFNISHEDEIIAFGVSRGTDTIGVDLVSTTTSNGWEDRWLDGFRAAFSSAEWQGIHASDNPEVAFYVYWALKEAYLKATGEGISDNMAVGEAAVGPLDSKEFFDSGILGPFAIRRQGVSTGLYGRVYRLRDSVYAAVVSPRLLNEGCEVIQLDYDHVSIHFRLT